MIYKFYLDRKVTVWERDNFEIDAETKEEAINRIKQQFSEEGDEFYIEGETETLYDTMEFLSAEENQSATIEIYDDETNECILTNWEDY